MADGSTPHYALIKPEVGASADSWGTKTNDNWDSVDALVQGIYAHFGSYLPLTGGTLSGWLQVGGPGVVYTGVGASHWTAFGWDGQFIQGFVDGGYNCQLASVGWVDGNFYPAGTTDARYLFKIGDTCSGSLGVNGTLTTQGTLQVNANLMVANGVFYVANNYSYYLSRNSSNGHWYIVENGTATFDLDPGGTLGLRTAINAPTANISGNATAGAVYGTNGIFAITDNSLGLFPSGADRYLRLQNGWDFHFVNATGNLLWENPYGVHLVFNYANSFIYNNQANLGGYGAYQNLSDERMKRDVTPAAYGLPEILRLEPIRFTRVPRSDRETLVRPPEIGLSAQAVRQVIPEAVTALGIELA
ncbi:MAG TPA: tail fiber domain-containing protein, partial [Steroidobacteraceae bacterium]